VERNQAKKLSEEFTISGLILVGSAFRAKAVPHLRKGLPVKFQRPFRENRSGVPILCVSRRSKQILPTIVTSISIRLRDKGLSVCFKSVFLQKCFVNFPIGLKNLSLFQKSRMDF